MTKKKIQIGDSIVVNNSVLVAEELFTADGVRWVRASKFRKKNTVMIYLKRYTYFSTDNTYYSEAEWLKLRK